jgi:catechol 2,3-dioxygenase-like lactoylglutathione lyase family enzyme
MSDAVPSPELYTSILRVSNLERSMEWYAEAFGMKPHNPDPSYRLVNMISSSGQRITLREQTDKPITPSSLHGMYVVFLTTNAEALRADMLRRGYKVGPVQDHPGVRLFWVFDPDQHPLCILEFMIEWG